MAASGVRYLEMAVTWIVVAAIILTTVRIMRRW
jgi:hypothetical protein